MVTQLLRAFGTLRQIGADALLQRFATPSQRLNLQLGGGFCSDS